MTNNLEDILIDWENTSDKMTGISEDEKDMIASILSNLSTLCFYGGDWNVAEVKYAAEDLGEGLSGCSNLFEKCPPYILGKILKESLQY